jgi:hypothetical protein
MLSPLFVLLFGLLPQRGGQTLPFPTNSAPQAAQAAAAIKCDTEIRWLNNEQKFYSLGNTFTLNLFTAAGTSCTPAEIRVTAIYLDYDENVVCSGVVDNVAQVDQNTQSVVLEIKPLTLLEFVRWRNGLRPSQPVAKRLTCIGPDQLTEVSRNETDRATSLRVFVTLLARNGGMSNLEVKVDPRR